MSGETSAPEDGQDSLEALMVLDALGESNVEQKVRLRQALANQPALAARHATLTVEVLRMKNALGTLQDRAFDPDKMPQVPEHVLRRLEDARREALTRKSLQQTSASNVVAFSPSLAQRNPEAVGPSKNRSRQSGISAWLARAAILALIAAVTGYWFLHKSNQPPIASAALAPRGETGLTQPLLVWQNDPDPNQRYDVWILPPKGGQLDAPALFTAKNVRSPLPFTVLKAADSQKGNKKLEPGKSYRLLVCFATMGRLSGVTVPFRTSADAEGGIRLPAEVPAMLLKAKRLIQSDKPGDALMVLASLPENERSNVKVKALEEQARKLLPAPVGPPRG